MDISKIPLNKSATAVKDEVDRFIVAFKRCKSAPPSRVALRADKYAQVEKAVFAELRRRHKASGSDRKLRTPKKLTMGKTELYPFS
ncbi:hypothetical protein [Microbulbifer sp. ALW1]|uniref:hypothetical protein n=1 Tax=Microbulbifer sp. (strain ALW1) TaxID=1516059 RepID=UPI001358C5BD|nr:hypothetical protein [Microbulbifer sp. ALW1]